MLHLSLWAVRPLRWLANSRLALFALGIWVGLLPVVMQAASPPQIRWATSVLGFSSQYSSPAYGAVQALGEPNVFPGYGDDAKAWSPSTENGQREYLELGYADPISVAGIAIYETYHPGAVDRVKVRSVASGEWVEVWTGTAAAAPGEARVLLISLPQTIFLVDGVRIELDSPNVAGWHEIDAVAIMDSDPATVGPVIGAFTITSAGADELFSELGDESVTGRVLLSDYFSGVASAELQLIDVSGNTLGQPWAASPSNSFDPVHYHKEWTGTVAIPRGTATGIYGLRIRALSVGGGESTVDQPGLFQVTDTLPRPDGHYQLSKVLATGDVGHEFNGRTYVVQDFGVNLVFSAPLMNGPGNMAFSARLRDQNNVLASAAYLQSGATRKVLANGLVTGFSGRPSSLNDAGWVSFVGSETAVPLSQGIYKSNGDETVLIDDSPNVGAHDPAINNHGVVVYRRPVPDTVNWELWKGDGTTRQRIFGNTDVNANDGSGHLVVAGSYEVAMRQTTGFPRMDDHGRVYFWANVQAGNDSLAVIARKDAPGVPLSYLVRGGPNRLYDTISFGFGISPNGRIVVGGRSLGSSNAAIPAGGWEWVDILGGTYLVGAQGRRYVGNSGSASGVGFGAFSINDVGRLAYLQFAGRWSELRSSIAPDRAILRPNHFLDGRRVKEVHLSWQAISERDEIACLVVFTDGHQAVYRASPLTSGGADFALQPDNESTAEPGGLMQYTFDSVASGSWLELPPRGEVTISSPSSGARIMQLLGISDHLADRAEVRVNGAVVGTLAPGEPIDLVTATGSSVAAVTLRSLAVSSARPQPLAVQLRFNNPTVELQIDGVGVPLLIQPPLRAHRPGELLLFASGAVDPAGTSFQWGRPEAGALANDERTAGAESGELHIYPYGPTDAGIYTLTGMGPDGSVQVSARVVNAVPFVNWAAAFFPGQEEDEAITGPAATPLGDGIPNLVKYAFGIDPSQPLTAADRERIARLDRVIPGEAPRLELRLVLQPEAVDVGLALEAAPDIHSESWTALGAHELAIRETFTAAGRELTVLPPRMSGEAQFYRLRLSYLPR